MIWSRGSEWRKWDLHVHVPGTCRENGYGAPNDENIAKFCHVVENSSVAAVGLTDYFRLEACFKVIDRYQELYPDSNKLLIPNLELRLGADGANPKAEAHILFDPALGWPTIRNMLARIETRHSTKESGSLSGHLGDFETSPVPDGLHVVDMESAVEQIGRKYADRILVIAVCGADGMSFATNSPLGQAKAAALRDNAHAGFGTPTDAERHAQERASGSPWNGPIFSGSDCHSFEDLTNRLGQSIQGSERDSNVTWIKANTSWDGLRQTIADPDGRVHIGPTQPETRRVGQVIESLRFPGGSVYPDDDMPLNPGLVTVIGSRSSGKSSLLAQIARAASPQQTTSRLTTAGKDDGPCAGHAWDDAQTCSIAWGDEREGSRGSLLYIPQDYIHQSASRVDDVTRRIHRILEKDRPDLHLQWQQIENARDATSDEAVTTVRELVGLLDVEQRLDEEVTEGEQSDALAEELSRVETERSSLDAQFALSPDETAALAEYRKTKTTATAQRDQAQRDEVALGRASTTAVSALAQSVTAQIELSGLRLGDVPSPLSDEIHAVVQRHASEVANEVGQLIDDQLDVWQKAVEKAEIAMLDGETRASSVLSKIATSENQIAEVEARLDRLRSAVDERVAAERKLSEVRADIEQKFTALTAQIEARADDLADFAQRLSSSSVKKDAIKVTAEEGFSPDRKRGLADHIDGRSRTRSDYFEPDGSFNIKHAQTKPEAFVRAVRTGSGGLRLKQAVEPLAFIESVLGTAPELHLVGELEGDRIGGFSPTSMSPGKSAQFAFELIVASARDECPILLDQPEDDLDSESIVASVLPRLRELRKTRQVLVVTHDANLVVGADADQVIVADRTVTATGEYELTYRAGPLEDETNPAGVPLIRESACKLLDGGVPAMEQRLARYRIGPSRH